MKKHFASRKGAAVVAALALGVSVFTVGTSSAADATLDRSSLDKMPVTEFLTLFVKK